MDVCVEEAPVDRLDQMQRSRSAKAAIPRAPDQPGPQRGSAPHVDVIAQARRAAAEAQDIPALAAAVAAFTGSAPKTTARGAPSFARGAPSFAGGAPAAAVMVIGEAPGADEERQGEPFAGAAGRLLDRMLDAAGLKERAFLTYTVFWRVQGDAAPSAEAQAACAPFLERAISLVRPRFLLLAGGGAAKSLLKTQDGILSLRGRWIDWSAEDATMKIPAMATFDPAFLLRQPAAKKKAWEDLLLLMSRLEAPD